MKQLGLMTDSGREAFEYVDPDSGKPVPWLEPDADFCEKLARAPWRLVKVEVTALSPAEPPLSLDHQEIAGGAHAEPRARLMTVIFPDSEGPQGVRTESIDLDRIADPERIAVLKAALAGPLVGHSPAFDARWLRHELTKAGVDPGAVPEMLDVALLARWMRPDAPVQLALMAEDATVSEEMREAAQAAAMQRKAGWALPEMALVILGKPITEEADGSARAWTRPVLSAAQFRETQRRANVGLQIWATLVDMANPEGLLDVTRRYLARNPQFDAFTALAREQLKAQEAGIPWSTEKAEDYARERGLLARYLAQSMIDIEPDLGPYENSMAGRGVASPQTIRRAVAAALAKRGVDLGVSPASGAPQMNAPSLRRAQSDATEEAAHLLQLWADLTRAKRAGEQAAECNEHVATANGAARLHPLTSLAAPSSGATLTLPAGLLPILQSAPAAVVEPATGRCVVAVKSEDLAARVIAACALRTQRKVAQVLRTGTFDFGGTPRATPPDVLEAIWQVERREVTLESCQHAMAAAWQAVKAWQAQSGGVSSLPGARRAYRDRMEGLRRQVLIHRMQRALLEIARAERPLGESCALQEMATAQGGGIVDPLGSYMDAGEELPAAARDEWAYAPSATAMHERIAEASGLNLPMARAEDLYRQLNRAFPEVELWRAWTALHASGQVQVPVPDRDQPGRWRTEWHHEILSLGGRMVCVVGTEAALRMEVEASVADILAQAASQLAKAPPPRASAIAHLPNGFLYEGEASAGIAIEQQVSAALESAIATRLRDYAVPPLIQVERIRPPSALELTRQAEAQEKNRKVAAAAI